MRAHKVDANQAEIVDALRRVGAVVIPMAPEVGFDLLVAYNANVYIVEVKQPGLQDDLTAREKRRRDELMMAGVQYCIVTSAEDALEVLGWMR